MHTDQKKRKAHPVYALIYAIHIKANGVSLSQVDATMTDSVKLKLAMMIICDPKNALGETRKKDILWSIFQ